MTRALRRLEPTEYCVGTDGTITIPLYDSAGAALSVSGKTASWKLYRGVARRRRKPFTGTAVLTKTSAASQIALSAGQAVVTIADSDLDGHAGEYWQSIQITEGDGDIVHGAEGPVFLRAGL